MATILLADDEEEFRKIAIEILKADKSLRIVEASNPDEALDHIRSAGIDVAIIDNRLRKEDQLDDSGLRVAQQSDPRIPIIMISQFEDRRPILAAINTRPDGYPLVVRFLDKNDITTKPELLLSTVHSALKKRELWAKIERERLSPELLRHYKSDRFWTHFYQALHYLTSFAFVGMIIVASFKDYTRTNLIFALIAMVAGEITNIVISQREGSIAQRADKNHSEILQATRFSQLFDACSSITDPDVKDGTRSDLIRTAAENWLVPTKKCRNFPWRRLTKKEPES